MNRTLTIAQRAWAAGIIDGEGCLHIKRDERSNGGVYFSLYLKVTMGHERTVRRLHEMFGEGTVTYHQPRNERQNGAWSWICSTRQAGQAAGARARLIGDEGALGGGSKRALS